MSQGTISLKLVSHHLCPYVQRAAIALSEKGIACERVYIDLARKPEWFRAISPLGRVPLLLADDAVIFESAVILEFLEETQPNPLHPRDVFRRAEHRSWIEFGSAILNEIAAFYRAPDADALEQSRARLREMFGRLEAQLSGEPWFDGPDFSLVDAAFGPVFRYFDTFDTIAAFGLFDEFPRIRAWRTALAGRASVGAAVTNDYPARLTSFLRARNSHLSRMLAEADHRHHRLTAASAGGHPRPREA